MEFEDLSIQFQSNVQAFVYESNLRVPPIEPNEDAKRIQFPENLCSTSGAGEPSLKRRKMEHGMVATMYEDEDGREEAAMANIINAMSTEMNQMTDETTETELDMSDYNTDDESMNDKRFMETQDEVYGLPRNFPHQSKCTPWSSKRRIFPCEWVDDSENFEHGFIRRCSSCGRCVRSTYDLVFQIDTDDKYKCRLCVSA